MPELTEITYVDVMVKGARGEVQLPDGSSEEAYFFIVDDPSAGKRHVIPMTEENKAHVIKGWSGLEIAHSMPPAMAVPKGR